MISSKAVAKKAGVSASTVSRVFSDSPLISDEVKKHVLEIAKEMHYVPNSNARNLKLKQNNTYGVVVSDSANPFYIKVINEFSSLKENLNKKIFVTFSQENSDTEYSCITSLVSANVEAILFTPTSNGLDNIGDLLISNNVPTLQLYRKRYDNLDSLVIDDEYGAYIATSLLLKKGHRKIILFDPLVSIPTYRDEGYRRAFKEFKLDIDEKYIVKVNLNEDPLKIMSEKIDKLKPTAIIPTGSYMTHSLYIYMGEHNLKIKDDISIIAYDDIEMAKYLHLSAISHPFNDIAKKASEMIENRKNDSSCAVEHISIKPFLIERDSIKDIN